MRKKTQKESEVDKEEVVTNLHKVRSGGFHGDFQSKGDGGPKDHDYDLTRGGRRLSEHVTNLVEGMVIFHRVITVDLVMLEEVLVVLVCCS